MLTFRNALLPASRNLGANVGRILARVGVVVACVLAAGAVRAATQSVEITLPTPGTSAPAPAPNSPPPGWPPPLPAYQPAAFTRLVVRLPVGAIAIVQQTGMFCAPAKTTVWPGGQTEWNIGAFKDVFRSEFESAGLKVEGDPNNLFETNTSTADFAVAGIVTDLSERFCVPNITAPEQKGEVTMSIQWELYSRLQKQIIGTYTTHGQASESEAVAGGLAIITSNAFRENVKQLAANPGLRRLLSGAPRGEAELVKPEAQAKIGLINPSPGAARNVDSTVSSVVLVRAGGDEGSAVLVSSDGYLLTAAHVVGDAPEVKVRWSDGVETVAEVVRVSRGRDVALLKTDARSHAPLGIRRDEPTIGEPVFAVGSTMGDRFQSSVTKGVMSADRIIDGYAYIQSDVTVGPGASGGPLLDAQGRVIGVTVRGIVALTPTGINLFVPARDAIDFLGLDVK
jgi:serine protease Do